jgi:hypothetical protein
LRAFVGARTARLEDGVVERVAMKVQLGVVVVVAV